MEQTVCSPLLQQKELDKDVDLHIHCVSTTKLGNDASLLTCPDVVE